MKKITVFLFSLFCAFGIQAQEYNLFDESDLDNEGWLWFDSQEKIDKYVGVCNEDDYCVQPEGKPVQMIYANILPDYPETVADPFLVGVGKEGVIGGSGFKTGGIILAPASSFGTTNGGGVVVKMPSCVTFSLSLSCESQAYLRIMGTHDINTAFNNYINISAHNAFNPLFKSGVYTWSGIESLDNGYDNAITLKSDIPVYGYLQNNTKYPLYLHGIRVTTKTKDASSVGAIQNDNISINVVGDIVQIETPENIRIYEAGGRLVRSVYGKQIKLTDLPKGIYLIKVGNNVLKHAVR